MDARYEWARLGSLAFAIGVAPESNKAFVADIGPAATARSLLMLIAARLVFEPSTRVR